MPWCNNCKKEYIEGISECPKCGSKLKDSANEATIKTINETNSGDFNHNLELKLLFTAESDVQYALITNALKQENILFTTETQKLWDHMQIIYSHTLVGQNVFVSEKDFDKAKEIYDYFAELKNEWLDNNED